MKKILLSLFLSVNLFASYIPNTISSSDDRQRVYAADLSIGAGTCTVNTQTGSWVSSASSAATGVCTINFNSGNFSSGPYCICSDVEATTNARVCTVHTQPSSASMVVFVFTTTTGSGTNDRFHVLCFGEK